MESLNNDIINKMYFNFKANNIFIGYAFGEEVTAKWSFSNEEKIIYIEGMEDVDIEFKILKLTKDHLALKLGLGEFLMRKEE
ncbi:MAG: hypothetical protein HRT66_04460 [Flavobacteriaceae bacterium]|nr:hypothetical protein [Flavobacteriaceae bacterium]